MNVDELQAQQRQLRKDVPALEFRAPDCVFCGKETNPVDDCFDCEECGLTWDRDGEFLVPVNGDVPRCGAEIKPWADDPEYPVLAGRTYRCVLDADHVETADMHRGYRIDVTYDDCTHAWPVVP